MNDTFLVGRFQRLGDLPRNGQRLVQRQGTFGNPIAARRPLDQREDQRPYGVSGFLVRRSASEGGSLTFFDAIDGGDVRVIQRRERWLRARIGPGAPDRARTPRAAT
jgi:hypothetical protein